VPSPHARRLIYASPLDPAADLAGALRDFSNLRGLRIVLWSEVPQSFQEFALILRRTLPRHAPHRISNHVPRSPFPSGNIAENHCRSKAHFVTIRLISSRHCRGSNPATNCVRFNDTATGVRGCCASPMSGPPVAEPASSAMNSPLA